MSIPLNRDDYAIIRVRRKPTLCLVLNPKSCKAVVDASLVDDDPVNFTYEEEDVLAGLGPEPFHGKVIGVDVAPYRKTIRTEQFGPIHLFRKVPKKEMAALRDAMKIVYGRFKKQASVAFLPLYQTRILPKKGKYAGSYTARTKSGDVFDVMKIHPETLQDPIFNEYLVAHEFAHGLWYRCVPPDIRAKWTALYQKRMKLSLIKEKHLQELCEAVIGYEGGVRDYMKEVADDEEKLVVKEVLAYFKRYHSMAASDVDVLIMYDSGRIASMWPTRAMLSEARPDISQYSMKCVEEFFAEAVAYHMTGKMLPKDVQKGLKATFKKCRKV